MKEKDYMNPLNWDKSQWKDALLAGAMTIAAFIECYIVIMIFI